MKNKFKIYSFLGLLTVVSLLVSCSRPFLEPWPPDGAREPKDVWNNYDYSKGFLETIYADHLFSYTSCDLGGGMLASASDEAMHSNPAGEVRSFTNGVWGPSNSPVFRYGASQYASSKIEIPWHNAYLAIRIANKFLENVDNSVLIDDISNPARKYDRTYYKAQAYFLRAFFQFDLFRKYGPFPISIKSYEAGEEKYTPRDKMSDCLKQIIADCDKAIEMMPELWDNNNWYRPNRAAAEALKSRVLLYWASPLYQGEFIKFGLPANSTGDVTRWKAAAKAAHNAINNNPFYELMPVKSFKPPYAQTGRYSNQIFNVGEMAQSEVIWGVPFWSTTSEEMYNLPTGLEGCYGYTNPTQDFVDEFEVLEGKKAVKFDWKNPDHAKNPYLNRDPRFYASISYNGLKWGLSKVKAFSIETFVGGKHNDPRNPNTTKTGYYFRKGLSEAVYSMASKDITARPRRGRFEFRFAELLLNWAESMNEAYGPEVADPDGALRVGPVNAMDAINLIRARVNMPPIAPGLSKDAMRSVIKHERAIELCFEGHRFYDLRRWKEGETLGKPVHGVVITPKDPMNIPDGGFLYEIKEVDKRVWRNCMYWYPIPYTEIVKYQGALEQNPEWK